MQVVRRSHAKVQIDLLRSTRIIEHSLVRTHHPTVICVRVIQGAGDHIRSRTRINHLPDSPHRTLLINGHTNRKRSEAKRFVVPGITDLIKHHLRMDLVHLDAYRWQPRIIGANPWISRIIRIRGICRRRRHFGA